LASTAFFSEGGRKVQAWEHLLGLLVKVLEFALRRLQRLSSSDRVVLAEFHRRALPAIDAAGHRSPPTPGDCDLLFQVYNDLTTLVRQYSINSEPFELHTNAVRGMILAAATACMDCLNPDGAGCERDYYRELRSLDATWERFNRRFALEHGYERVEPQ